MITAVILARAGSKRLPGKNTMVIGGRPMVAWSILEASRACFVDEIIVSSNDDEALSIAEEYGAIPLHRPTFLAQDTTSSYGPLLHAISYSDMVEDLTHAILLQPTSPLRLAIDIDRCVNTCIEMGLPAAQTCEVGKEVANGAVYVGEIGWLRAGGNWDEPLAKLVPMPPERSVDIDTAEDFENARLIIEGNREINTA